MSSGTAATAPAAVGARRRLPAGVEALLVVVVSAAAVGVLHRTWLLLPYPYWLDEAWVALSVHRPLSELPDVTSSTPLGWTLLLRLPAALPGEPLRLLPMAFHAAAVGTAYLLGRTVGRGSRRPQLAGLLFAVVLALSPFLLERDDLKPYTADCAVVVLVLLLVARLDSRWRTRDLWVLALVSSACMLVSQTAAFASGAALLAVTGVQLVQRRWRRAAAGVAAGLVAAAVLLCVYLLAARPSVNDKLKAYWVNAYLPHDPHAALAFLVRRGAEVPALLAVRWWALLAVLLAAGLVLLVSRRLASVAVTVLLMGVLALASGAANAYPLLDQRTSTWLYTAMAVTVAAGLLGAAAVLARLHWSLALVPVVAWLASAGQLAERASYPDIALEDVRAQVQVLERVRQPGDVVLTAWASGFAYAYYTGDRSAAVVRDRETTVGYHLEYPATADVVTSRDRTPQEQRRAHLEACRRAGPSRHVWRVSTHRTSAELKVWAQLADELPFTSRPTTGDVSHFGLDLLTCGARPTP